MIELQDRARVGDWIQTFSGLAMYPLDPRFEEICLEDIAQALGNMCRFTGHTRRFYSVAEHSLWVSHIAVPLKWSQSESHKYEHEQFRSIQLAGLLHDASEAYLSDIARPVKVQPEFASYRRVESKLQQMIYAKFGLEPEMPELVRRADEIMLAIEARDLMSPLRPAWEKWLANIGDCNVEVRTPMPPEQASQLWLLKVNSLLEGRGAAR
jgi:uncharacterized protein